MEAMIFAIWINSLSEFEASLPTSSTYETRVFPNNEDGIQQLGKWWLSSGLKDIDHVCVANGIESDSPVFEFWLNQKVPVFLLNPARVHAETEKQNRSKPLAEVVASICANMFSRKNKP